MDILGQMLLQSESDPAPRPPARQPAGRVTPILRSELQDITDPRVLGDMVTSADVTEADIDRTVMEALTAQASQDELVEEGGRLIGLRISETRPAPVPAQAPAAPPAAVVPSQVPQHV